MKKSDFFSEAESSGKALGPDETPFAQVRHDNLLSRGTIQYHEEPGKNRMYIVKRVAGHKGKGYGTAAMRLVVEESFSKGYQGNVSSETSWSSHLFHLKMGMIPVDRELDYVTTVYGYFVGRTALMELRDNSYIQQDLTQILKILRKEKNIPNDQVLTETSLSENENREFLLDLLEKRISYLSDYFIPTLIALLDKTCNEAFPDTDIFSCVPMDLSEEGKARWKDAIDREIEFKPFRNFEQLHPVMTDEQRVQMDYALAKRSAALEIRNTP